MSIEPPSTITITASTVQGWPDIEPNVRSFEAAAAAVGGDVVVTDGSGLPAPPPGALGPRTTWLSEPGKSVFQLRLSAYRVATAPIIGVTEDHCFLPEDWARRNLEAHAMHPEAAAIGGSVVNGATESTMDWASFLIVQSLVAAPIPSGPTARIAGAVSVSYKRAALTGLDEHAGMGAMDGLHQRELAASGAALIADDGIRVVHDQSLGFGGTVAIHFHAGRTFAGFRRQQMDAGQAVRILATPLVPLARFVRTARLVSAKGYGRELLRATPAMWLLLVTQTAGQVIGYVAGPGDSPNRVQ
ncbi:MAG TPA: hypothetical protein VM408_06255 [Methylomirabilota bacterium]|nr:hypothetical protein [Methylomirabilota bacterium]